MISDAKFSFLESLKRWKVDAEQPFESRFLMREGHYIGNQFLLGDYVGNWISESNEVQIFLKGQWRLTVPVQQAPVENESRPATIEFQPSTTSNQTVSDQKKAA